MSRPFAARPAWAAAALPALALIGLQGCATPKPEVAAKPIPLIYTQDLKDPAKICMVPNQVDLSDGKTAEVSMVVGNDGGWCGIGVSRPGPEAYDAGLLTGRAAHGRVYIHSVGAQTRTDYTPEPGYAGPDQFQLKLLPGGAVMQVAVTVQAVAGAAPAAAAPTPEPAKKPATTHHHRRTTKKR